MTCRSRLFLSVLILLTATVLVKGQFGSPVYGVSCNPDIGKTIQVTLFSAQGHFVYIIGCPSTEGEFGGGGVPTGGVETVTFTSCNIIWGNSYVAILTAQQGVILKDDWKYSLNFTCTLNTAPLNVNAALTATVQAIVDGWIDDIRFTSFSPTSKSYLDNGRVIVKGWLCTIKPIYGCSQPLILDCYRLAEDGQFFARSFPSNVGANTPTASIEDQVDPNPLLKITDDTQTYTGTPLNTAYVGQRVRLHVYILPFLRDSFDIWVIQITVETSEVGPVILTGVDGAGTLDGCQAKHYFAGVTRIGPGELMVEFDAFMLSPGTTTEDVQDWQVTTGVCAGLCSPVDCSGAPFGVRRKRDMSNDTTTYEEVHLRSSVKVTAFPQYTETDVDVSANEAQNGEIQECEVCMQKSVMYGVMAVLVLPLVLSLAVSCFLFLRARRSRKIQQEDSQIHSSVSPSYKR